MTDLGFKHAWRLKGSCKHGSTPELPLVVVTPVDLKKPMCSFSILALNLLKKGREWDSRGRDHFFDSYGPGEGSMFSFGR